MFIRSELNNFRWNQFLSCDLLETFPLFFLSWKIDLVCLKNKTKTVSNLNWLILHLEHTLQMSFFCVFSSFLVWFSLCLLCLWGMQPEYKYLIWKWAANAVWTNTDSSWIYLCFFSPGWPWHHAHTAGIMFTVSEVKWK